MTAFSLLPFGAAALGLLLALASLARKNRTLSTWCFFAGMTGLALDSLLTGLCLRASGLETMVGWLSVALGITGAVAIPWLCFGLAYSRANGRLALTRWRVPLTLAALAAVGLPLAFPTHLLRLVPAGPQAMAVRVQLGPIAKLLHLGALVAFVLVLANLEQTFRSAAGTMRWRIKFVVLGLALVFGVRLYVGSQAILFTAHDLRLAVVESSALLIGSLFLVLAYARSGFAEIDVYPSRAVLRSSLTMAVAGGYLFAVGVLAQLVKRLGGAENFQLQAFVVLLGMAGLGVLLLSDRLRQRIRAFVGRHFRKAQHDSIRVWSESSRQLAGVRDRVALCEACARFVSDTFEVLSVSVWLLNEEGGQCALTASTNSRSIEGTGGRPNVPGAAIAAALKRESGPFNLEKADAAWADEWRRVNPSHFPNGGERWSVALRTAEQPLGALVLADRVNGAPYSTEELALLQCVADHVTSALLNLRLADEVAQAREMEAFRAMSAFFVHDLKNAATSLNLTLKNLPVHFDDPAFREDALRAIGNTARRIDATIARLSALRQRPDFRPIEADLNELVDSAIETLPGAPGVELTRQLQPLPAVLADPGQIQSVVTNLLLNACEAVGAGGRVRVVTERREGWATLSVTDNGCGMSPAFLKDCLFRPFQSTKKKGLGIGMFQSRQIVEAHGGTIRVDSEAGRGTSVRVSLPARNSR